jgi:ribosomal protein S18 acetylase RimI-like enzyme
LAVKTVKATPRDAYALSVLTREYFDYAKLSHDKILKRLRSHDFEYWLARDEKGKLAGFIDVDFTPVQGLRKGNATENPRDAAVEPKQKTAGATIGAKARRETKRMGTRKATRSVQAKILGLAVLPEFRGRGIARQLIAKAEARAKARGCREIFLLVKEDNAVAQTLYSKLGFVLRGALAEKLWSKTILLYAKDLKK